MELANPAVCDSDCNGVFGRQWAGRGGGDGGAFLQGSTYYMKLVHIVIVHKSPCRPFPSLFLFPHPCRLDINVRIY